jgi:hypothetical protein
VITFLGVFSIGVFLLPADVAAGLALVWLGQAGRLRLNEVSNASNRTRGVRRPA